MSAFERDPRGATIEQGGTVPDALGLTLADTPVDTTSLRREVLALHDVIRLALQAVHVETQWEYRLAAPKRASWVGEGLAWAEREFNQLGTDGWELVGFLEHGTAVFKRRAAV